MSIITLLNDFNIPYTETGKNVSTGWIGLQCPFCDDASDHLGYNTDDNFFSCWKCGWHSHSSTISKLLNVTESQAKSLLKQYRVTITKVQVPKTEPEPKRDFRLPLGTIPIQDYHKTYLIKRGFDPDTLIPLWNLQGTGPYGELGGINYKFRIIIPYMWEGQSVSFTARDITNKAQLRYITCPAEYEITPHKSILYGKQEAWKNTGIVVEGPTDVWRLGTSSCAVSGIKFTPSQVRVIASQFNRVAVCFDNDPQAVIQAAKLVAELKFRGVDAFPVDIEDDPASMKQEDADYLVKQLIK